MFDDFLTLLWGCPQLCKTWKANHHPQKKPIPRQAGQAQAICIAGIHNINPNSSGSYTFVVIWVFCIFTPSFVGSFLVAGIIGIGVKKWA